jgi:hypothetical protein
MSLLGDVGQDAGKLGATALIDIDLRRSDVAAALFGLEESGAITPIPARPHFVRAGRDRKVGQWEISNSAGYNPQGLVRCASDNRPGKYRA